MKPMLVFMSYAEAYLGILTHRFKFPLQVSMEPVEPVLCHSALMLNLIKLFRKRKQLSQHQCLTPIESGITSSQILQIQNSLD